MDIYFEIKEIKERQEKMLLKFDDLFKEHYKKRLYSLEELIEVLKVSRRTIFTWLKRGILPHSKVGGKIWVTEDHLKSFMETNSCNTIVRNKSFKL
jgi:excisionase family DNA binding protein